MRAIVFGGAGFLGSHVVDELKSKGHQVTVYDLKEGWDIMHCTRVYNATRDHDVVYNFAGVSDLNFSKDNPNTTVELNILGNLNILKACETHKVKRFIYASTVYAASDKGSFYGISKQAAERITRETKIPYTIIRYGSVYGPRSDKTNRIYRLIEQALTEGKMTYKGYGNEEREYIHVRDAARLSVDILEDVYLNKTVMLTGTERYNYIGILNMLNEMMGGKIHIELDEQEYGGHYHLTPYSFSPDVAKKLTLNHFTDFGQGLLETIEDISARIRSES